MSADIIWMCVGLFFGYLLCLNRKIENIPKDLEQCNIERTQQEEDLIYYKKLTKSLVDENTQLRKKVNGLH